MKCNPDAMCRHFPCVATVRVAHPLVLWLTLAGLMLFAGVGCSSKAYLMPTPNIYTQAAWNPFADVAPALQNDEVTVMYFTDRSPEDETPGQWSYGHARSRSAAFGEAVVKIGQDLEWDEIVAASRTADRSRRLELTLTTTNETARFGNTPPALVITDAQFAAGVRPPIDSANAEAESRFREDLARRLALTPHKEVFIYVHGFNNSFEDAVVTTAELWHFLGREGVPISYTWPAAEGGLRAYEYTLASTQFTIYHFKQALRLIASCPEVERINILAHSRGAEVTAETVRELYIEMRGTTDVQQTLKLGTVILAAADIDLDVAIARNATERIGRAVERSALYISNKDQALGFSGWLFGGTERVGNFDPELFNETELETLRHSQRFQIIDARVKNRGAFGHGYFHANPAVSSDLILLMRYRLPPGADHGRPLGVSDTGLWMVDDDYPGTAWALPQGSEDN